jgi:hypothetical protein
MKLSGFVELFVLIISVKKVFEIESIFIEIKVKYLFDLLHFFALFAKNKKFFFRKVDDNASLVTQILKLIRYSDSS